MTREIFILFILCSLVVTTLSADISECDYYDTVDLRNSQSYENGSYVYKNILIPGDKVAAYDYRKTLYGSKKNVTEYFRGCICEIKSCVLLCCEPEKYITNIGLNITLKDGTDMVVNEMDNFVYQTKFEISCELLEDPNDISFEWKLFENGSLHILNRNKELSKRDYCLVPVRIRGDYYELWPLTPYVPEIQTKETLDYFSAIRIVSIFCMSITIFIYLYLPKFHTVYGRCCVYYYICLTISYLLLWAEELYRHEEPTITVCYLIGYCGYFMVMTVFLWLLVINFHLWKSFKNFGLKDRTNTIVYQVFVWITATILLTVTASVEYSLKDIEQDEDSESFWQPGVAKYYCWINTRSWSAMLYFYGPIFLGILINLFLSIITARHIYVENKKNTRTLNDSYDQNEATNKANFGIFFRLFAISGVIWILDIISYMFEVSNDHFTWIFDIITTSQGILLFFMTIWKKDVLQALYEHMDSKKGNAPNEELSSTSMNRSNLHES